MIPLTRRLAIWGPAAGQMAVIFVLSSIPDLGGLPGGLSDKTGHFLGYGLLAALVLRALAGGRLRGVTWKRAVLAVALCSLYGASDELHQLFVRGRSSDVLDWAADSLGAALSAAGVYALATLLAALESRGPGVRVQ